MRFETNEGCWRRMDLFTLNNIINISAQHSAQQIEYNNHTRKVTSINDETVNREK